MSKRPRRDHTASFKGEAMKGKTLAEVAQQFGLHLNQITQWKAACGRTRSGRWTSRKSPWGKALSISEAYQPALHAAHCDKPLPPPCRVEICLGNADMQGIPRPTEPFMVTAP